MNIFKQYGIKEVADVTLYSITRIGTEEFYTPVLYLDTLKVSSLDKKVNNVNANGGKGNGRTISWSFDKGVTLKLEDALFSQQSLDTFMNGRVMAKMSDWTSALAKINVANKYGRLHYSTKAFASPALTDAEWEVVYRCAERVGYDPRHGEGEFAGTPRNSLKDRDNHTLKYTYDTKNRNEDGDTMVAENRWLLKQAYTKRKQPTYMPQNLAEFLAINTSKYDNVSLVIVPQTLEHERGEALGFKNRTTNFFNRKLVFTYRDKTLPGYDIQQVLETELHVSFDPTTYEVRGVWANGHGDLELVFSSHLTFTGVTNSLTFGDEFFLDHILYYLFPNYLEEIIDDLCWCDLHNITYKAMPKSVILEIEREIDNVKRVGHFENDLSESQYIDRFEKCVVGEDKPFNIDVLKQAENVKKRYEDVQDTYSIFYDAKTMRPFMQDTFLPHDLRRQKCMNIITSKSEDLTPDVLLYGIKNYLTDKILPTDAPWNKWVSELMWEDIAINKIVSFMGSDNFIYFNVLKSQYMTLKPGTVYHKWSRTINEDTNELTFIGTDLCVDEEDFSGEYMIVGETLIREQKTGADKHCQLIINRATVTSSTKLNLQAGGSPLTFSMDITALVPIDKNKSTFELKMFDVEEDKLEGGNRIVPQSREHVTTHFMQKREEIVLNNEEIY